jgi:hypothetical protein
VLFCFLSNPSMIFGLEISHGVFSR